MLAAAATAAWWFARSEPTAPTSVAGPDGRRDAVPPALASAPDRRDAPPAPATDPASAASPLAASPTADAAAVRRALVPLLRRRLEVETLLAAAFDEASAGRIPAAIERVNAAIASEPDNAVAKLLLRHLEGVHEGRIPKGEAGEPRDLRTWIEDIRRRERIEDLLLRWPSASFWEAVKSARGDSPPPFTLSRTDLDAIRVDLTIENASIASAARRLVAETAVEIVTAGAGTTPARYLRAQSMPLSAALDALVAGTGLAWRIEGPRVEVFDAGAPPPTELKLRYYDVKDLAVAGGVKLDDEIVSTPDDVLADRVRREVRPEFWSLPGASIDTKNHILIVRATPAVHDRICDWLEARRPAAPESATAPASPPTPPTYQEPR